MLKALPDMAVPFHLILIHTSTLNDYTCNQVSEVIE